MTPSEIIDAAREADPDNDYDWNFPLLQEFCIRFAAIIIEAKQREKDAEGFDQAALDAASREVHLMLLREGSSWGTKACEEIGRVFMTAYRKAIRGQE